MISAIQIKLNFYFNQKVILFYFNVLFLKEPHHEEISKNVVSILNPVLVQGRHVNKQNITTAH